MLLLAGTAVGAGTETEPSTIPPAPRWPARTSLIRVSNPRDAVAVNRALLGARRRLGAARCRQLLEDFKDESGRTLQANLDQEGRTAEQRLDEIFFYDGDERRCNGTGVLALATPGARVVRICPEFARVQERQPEYAEAIILHETLHTLGLGENPPTSSFITRTVLQHCGP